MAQLYTLENSQLRLSVSPFGAELQSIFLKATQQEVLWQGNPKIWGRRAPWLFPIVGKIFDDQYQLHKRNFSLKQHGFARDLDFSLTQQAEDSLSFKLASSDKTLPYYPFHFELLISYTILATGFTTKIEVTNKTPGQALPFSFGAHPAFVGGPGSQVKMQQAEEAYFQFKDGETPTTNEAIKTQKQEVQLHRDIVNQQAMVFKGLNSQSVYWITPSYSMELDFVDWPDFALWSKDQDQFLCLEPWCGTPQVLEGDKNRGSSPFAYKIENSWTRTLKFNFR